MVRTRQNGLSWTRRNPFHVYNIRSRTSDLRSKLFNRLVSDQKGLSQLTQRVLASKRSRPYPILNATPEQDDTKQQTRIFQIAHNAVQAGRR